MAGRNKFLETLLGRRFGQLVVFRLLAKRSKVLVRCDCGKQEVIPTRYLKRKSPRTRCSYCAGRWLEPTSQTNTPEYVSWNSMLLRCTYKGHSGYYRYGGRGIKVHPQFQQFEGFLQYLGWKPTPFHTVDRIDPDGDYEPGNVRWATPVEQARNKSPKNQTQGDSDHAPTNEDNTRPV